MQTSFRLSGIPMSKVGHSSTSIPPSCLSMISTSLIENKFEDQLNFDSIDSIAAALEEVKFHFEPLILLILMTLE